MLVAMPWLNGSPSPWLTVLIDAVGALGTAAAAIVAVTLAARERGERREERRERLEAQAELRTSRDRERRSLASGVLVTVRDSSVLELTGHAPGDPISRSWEVNVENTGQAPIRHVRIRIAPVSKPAPAELVRVADHIAPSRSATAHGGLSARGPSAAQYQLRFDDAHGVAWVIDETGTLVEDDR